VFIFKNNTPIIFNLIFENFFGVDLYIVSVNSIHVKKWIAENEKLILNELEKINPTKKKTIIHNQSFILNLIYCL